MSAPTPSFIPLTKNQSKQVSIVRKDLEQELIKINERLSWDKENEEQLQELKKAKQYELDSVGIHLLNKSEIDPYIIAINSINCAIGNAIRHIILNHPYVSDIIQKCLQIKIENPDEFNQLSENDKKNLCENTTLFPYILLRLTTEDPFFTKDNYRKDYVWITDANYNLQSIKIILKNLKEIGIYRSNDFYNTSKAAIIKICKSENLANIIRDDFSVIVDETFPFFSLDDCCELCHYDPQAIREIIKRKTKSSIEDCLSYLDRWEQFESYLPEFPSNIKDEEEDYECETNNSTGLSQFCC